MANVQIILNRDIYLDSVATPISFTDPIYVGDAYAQRIRFRTFQKHGNLAPLDLSETTITAHFIRPDDADVVITGVGGAEWSYVDLPAACYVYPGLFKLLIRAVGDEKTTSIAYITGRIDKPTTDTIIDPGETIPSLEELLAQIENCERATTAANTAAASVPGLIAETFSTSVAYSAGDYVYHEGSLYRFTADHAAGAWTGTGATACKVGPEVSNLKTAFERKNIFEKSGARIISVIGNTSGSLVGGGGVSSVAIPVEQSTQYTISFWGGNRRLLWETADYPAVGGTWLVNDGELTNSGETVDGNNRYVKTITTNENTHYLLLYFYTETTGAENVLNTIQVEKGAVMTAYTNSFSMPDLYKDKTLSVENAVPDSKAVGDRFASLPQQQYTNLFDKSNATIVSIAVNASTLAFVGAGGVQSVIVPCNPNTNYTVAWKSIGSKSAFFVAPSTDVPVIGGTANARITLSSVADDGRHYGTFETGANDNYLLLWFWNEATGGDETLNSIQVNTGEELQDYTNYGYTLDGLNIKAQNIFGGGFGLEMLPDYVVDLLGYRQLGALDKGYICLVADDGTADVSSVSFSIVQTKNVPITFALWSTSACVTDSALLAQLNTMISNYGCSVAQHGVGNFATDYTIDSLLNYLAAEKAAWEEIGIEPKGMVYPNHGNNAAVRTICGSMYDVACTGGTSTNKDHVYPNDTLGTRSNMFALYRVSTYSTSESTLKTMCDYAAENRKLLIIWWHDNDIVNEQTQIDKINSVIDYAKTKGLEFITVGDIPNL